MTMTYEWLERKKGRLTILDGPAAGTYPFNAFSTMEAGILHLGLQSLADGRHVQLKIDCTKNLPGLAEEIAHRHEEAVARAQAPKKAREARAARAQQMVRAGFSTGSAILDREAGWKQEEA